jgi:hypothetical protein
MKAVFQYLLFVGISVLGVLGVLRIGSNLQAPVSVGDAWGITLNPSTTSASNCFFPSSEAVQLGLLVVQSGPSLTLQFSDEHHTTLKGEIQGTTIMAATPNSNSSPADLRLTAEVDRSVEPDQMQGMLEGAGCPAPLPFQAVRLPSTRNASGAH